MTFICSVVGYQGVFHGCDRLLSRGGERWDRQSNKTIIYRASDAILVMSYTGSSFIDDWHTDEWIVEQLTGEPMRTPYATGLIRGHGVAPLHSMNEALGTLQRALSAAWKEKRFQPGGDEWPLEVLVSGWLESGANGYRPISGRISNPDCDHKFKVAFGKRSFSQRELSRYTTAPMAHLKGTRAKDFFAEIGKMATTAEILNAVARHIRAVSDDGNQKTVGRDCMLVHIPPPTRGDPNNIINVRYDAAPETIEKSNIVAYSPLLIGRQRGPLGERVIMKPAEVKGKGLCFGIGDFKVLHTHNAPGDTGPPF